jgi:pimeloyl-ACP methyl ester carboxylesterase
VHDHLTIPYHPPEVVQANGIKLVYDAFGERAASPILLIMGLGGQLISWDEEFCIKLAAEGFWVIRFDHRDAGLATRFDEAGAPDVLSLHQASLRGEPVEVPYTLNDMAMDAAGLLDTLEVPSAHVVGVSMGGMIGQILAIQHPQRVRSLTCAMSTTGDPDLPPPTPEALAIFLAPPAKDRAAYLEGSLDAGRVLNGPNFPFDEDRARQRSGQSYDRGYYPAGTARHLAAVIATPGRRAALACLSLPALVIHGEADPLLPLACGEDIARSLPGAKLMMIQGMGHDLHPDIWPALIEAITGLAHKADQAA